jgi:hypothetical protein
MTGGKRLNFFSAAIFNEIISFITQQARQEQPESQSQVEKREERKGREERKSISSEFYFQLSSKTLSYLLG